MSREVTAAAILASYEVWDAADNVASDAMEHALGCDCTECCAIRVEAVRAATVARGRSGAS